jgi:Rad3-related DNA helicase
MNVLENMSSEKYIYPVLNESFTNNIGNRFEFDIPVIKENNTCETDDFKLAPYQIFLKNYISNDTPYNSILIYHGTGTGKTCSAISIAENYRDVYHRENKKIIILSSGNIKQGWYNNIYNPSKLLDQCTGSTYGYLANDQDTKMKRDKLVKKYYDFFGYLKFANRIRDIYDD